MWYIIFSVFIAAFFLMGAYGCKWKKGGTNILNTNISPDDTIKRIHKRSEIKEKLEALADAPAPTELKQGAMCYAPRIIENNYQYICPKCGEKTKYSELPCGLDLDEIPLCRYYLDSIPVVDIELEESLFCKKCSPDADQPQLCISYKFPDDKTDTRVCGICLNDLKLMKEFIQGRDKHITFNDSEVPLKDYLPRLQELFGVKIELEHK